MSGEGAARAWRSCKANGAYSAQRVSGAFGGVGQKDGHIQAGGVRHWSNRFAPMEGVLMLRAGWGSRSSSGRGGAPGHRLLGMPHMQAPQPGLHWLWHTRSPPNPYPQAPQQAWMPANSCPCVEGVRRGREAVLSRHAPSPRPRALPAIPHKRTEACLARPDSRSSVRPSGWPSDCPPSTSSASRPCARNGICVQGSVQCRAMCKSHVQEPCVRKCACARVILCACVRVRVRVHVCARVRVHVCGWVGGYVCVGMHMCVQVHACVYECARHCMRKHARKHS